MRWPWQSESKADSISLNQLIQRLEGMHNTLAGIAVTPETCMESSTVQALVTAISRRVAISPVHVFQKTVETKDGRTRTKKELLPNHPVERLLQRPNSWQSSTDYWQDATSSILRYGRYFAQKIRPATGPIGMLNPIVASSVQIERKNGLLFFHVTFEDGNQKTLTHREMHYVRSAARNFYRGDSPVTDGKTAIATEIAAERYGATFFGNGALPYVFFSIMEGFQDFKTQKDKDDFIGSFQRAFTGAGRFRGMLMPEGVKADINDVDNEKTQFIQTRRMLQAVIAGMWGVPPHLVGNLERATFNNVEQQDTDFVVNVVLPYTDMFQDGMERDLLTDEDRRKGVIIRFNLDSVLRASFKDRQEGLNIQRRAGIINPNEWREHERMNPISEDDGGEDYIHEANFVVSGEEVDPNLVINPRRNGGSE